MTKLYTRDFSFVPSMSKRRKTKQSMMPVYFDSTDALSISKAATNEGVAAREYIVWLHYRHQMELQQQKDLDTKKMKRKRYP